MTVPFRNRASMCLLLVAISTTFASPGTRCGLRLEVVVP